MCLYLLVFIYENLLWVVTGINIHNICFCGEIRKIVCVCVCVCVLVLAGTKQVWIYIKQ